MLPINSIICGNCADVMAQFPDNSIDLTVTSPPYDNLRTYKGYTFDFEAIAKQLYRVTKPGGVVVWVVADATIKGSETLTSFKQAIYFKEVCGFNVHDTMVYEIMGTGAKGSKLSYWQSFEYMFVLSKGKPSIVNRITKTNKRVGAVATRGRVRADGTKKDTKTRVVNNTGIPGNVWSYLAGNNGDNGGPHPAKFPEKLARDHILSWSNPGNTVLDPMCGSGTTLKMAHQHGRNYIGIDIAQEYCDIAERRVSAVQLAMV